MNHRQYHVAKGLDEAIMSMGEFNNKRNVKAIDAAVTRIVNGFNFGGKVLVCGNGGSACDAMHFAEELTGRFRKNRKALPAISLTDAAHITCVGNDFGFDYIFSRGIEAHGHAGDVLVAISTSGNSKNILMAVEQARGLGMDVICLLGKDGGALKGKGDIEIIVPSKTTERIQELHMVVLHLLVEMTEREMFPGNYE